MTLLFGQLLLLVQSFCYYFARLPVGARVVRERMRRNLVSASSTGSPNYLYPTIRIQLHYPHVLCWWLVSGMTVLNHGYAHTRMATGSDTGLEGDYVDCP